MAYIGKSIESGTFSVLDTSGNTYNGSNTTFNLGTQVGSVAQLLVSHDGVIQKPGTDYTLASGGTQITFTTAPASGASIFIVEISGAVGGPLDSDLNGTELILDADGDTSITADTDDQIDIKIAGDDDFTFTASTLTVNSTNKICFNDATQFIQGASGTVLDIAATDEIELTSTLVDLNGNLDVSGTTLLPTLGVITAKDLGAGIHIRHSDSGFGGTLSTSYDSLVIEKNGNSGITFLGPNDANQQIRFGDDSDEDIGLLSYNHNGNSLTFGVNAADRMRITSGGIIGIGQALDGVSSDSTIGASMHPEGRVNICYSGTGGHALMTFRNGNNEIGSISNSGTSGIAYNTSSDYRLKENVDYNFDATTRLKQLKPARFNFIADEDNTLVDGFLAHEVSSVVPEAVRGAKDAVDDDGNAVHQGIDQSKLVPLLVKTVQELEARIATARGLMLLGHGAIGQFGVAEALPGTVVNAGTVELSLGSSATASAGTLGMTGSAVFAVTTAGAPSFSLGTEVATGGANVSPTTAGSITASVGEETAFGEAFQNLISLSAGSPNFFLWNEVDDSADATWKDVDPGSTD